MSQAWTTGAGVSWGRHLPPTSRVRVPVDEPVAIAPLSSTTTLPIVVASRIYGLDLASWTRSERARIDQLLLDYGGVLLRGFDIGRDGLAAVVRAASGPPLEYTERSSPRTHVGNHIYTSTDYAAEHEIALHNENSYQSSWPLHILFFCRRLADSGGETPIAHCGRVLGRIDPVVRQRFARTGWTFVRNLGEQFGLPWQTTFQTDDRREVEEICRHRGLGARWKGSGALRVEGTAPAVVRHPRTGENVWFNHALFFHPSSLDESVRDVIVGELDEEDLPTMTYYGDGAPIEKEALESIRSAYQSERILFPWRPGDVLLLDNMLAAHGRAAYSGPREVLVGMATAVGRDPWWRPGKPADVEEQR